MEFNYSAFTDTVSCVSALRLAPPIDSTTGLPMTAIECTPDPFFGSINASPCVYESPLGTLTDTEGIHSGGCTLDHSPSERSSKFNMQSSRFVASPDAPGGTIKFTVQAVEQNTEAYSNESTVTITIQDAPCKVVPGGATDVEVAEISGEVGAANFKYPESGYVSTLTTYNIDYNACKLMVSGEFGVVVRLNLTTLRINALGEVTEVPGPVFPAEGFLVCSADRDRSLAAVDPCGGVKIRETVVFDRPCSAAEVALVVDDLGTRFMQRIERLTEFKGNEEVLVSNMRQLRVAFRVKADGTCEGAVPARDHSVRVAKRQLSLDREGNARFRRLEWKVGKEGVDDIEDVLLRPKVP